MFKIKLFCANNHELVKKTKDPNKNSSKLHCRFLCINCNEYKTDKEIANGIYCCDKCGINICHQCVMERFNLHFT